jgi:hypothetical protein
MSSYRFSMHKDLASVESFGAVSLDDDAEAAAFAASVIRDMKIGADGRYDGWTMDITRRGRNAASIPFDSVEIAQ